MAQVKSSSSPNSFSIAGIIGIKLRGKKQLEKNSWFKFKAKNFKLQLILMTVWQPPSADDKIGIFYKQNAKKNVFSEKLEEK